MSFSELFANLKPGFYISGKRQILNKVLNLTVFKNQFQEKSAIVIVGLKSRFKLSICRQPHLSSGQ